MVSIIVPVYNVEKYLARTLDCILRQTYSDLEIIVIDDGSTDSSGKICDEYAVKDKRVFVIHQAHKGISDVRNIGIETVKGDYTVFIDSDDLVSDDYVEYMLLLLQRDNTANFSACSIQVIRENAHLIYKKDNGYKILNTNQAFENLLYDKGLFLSVWGKLFKTEFIKKFVFPVGRVYEDTAVIYRLIEEAGHIALGQQICYYYIMRENSISNAKDFGQKDIDYQEHTWQMIDFIREKHPELEKALRRFYIYANFRLMRILLFSNPRHKDKEKEIWENIKKVRCKVFFDIKSPVRDKIAIFVSLFGKGSFKLFWFLYRKCTNRLG